MRGDRSQSFAVALARRREDHRDEFKRLVRLRGFHQDAAARAELYIARHIAIAEDSNHPALHRARAADAVLAADEMLDVTLAELDLIKRQLDEELERFHAGQHPCDPLLREATLAEDIARSDDDLAARQEADHLTSTHLRRRADRLRCRAGTIRASVSAGVTTPGLGIARRSPSSSGRPRARRSRPSNGDGDGSGPSDADEPGEAGHQPTTEGGAR